MGGQGEAGRISDDTAWALSASSVRERLRLPLFATSGSATHYARVSEAIPNPSIRVLDAGSECGTGYGTRWTGKGP